MKEIVFVGTGGFIGASLRYIASTWFFHFPRFSFPLGALAVNFIGCTLLDLFKMTAFYVLGSIIMGLCSIGLGILITR